jgi:uncharacterized repeat protein (TIGR01451 family)
VWAARRIWLAVAAAVIAGIALPSGASAGTAASCGYGTDGPFASNLCWFDMSDYDDAQARSASGQQMSVGLQGGYTVEFTIKSEPVAGAETHAGVESRTVPLEPRFAFGSTESGGGRAGGYIGTPGEPALYSIDQGDANGVELTLSDITVEDASGAAVTGYRFVIADAENNIDGENFTWTSDQPLDLVGVLNSAAPTGCEDSLTGLGTTSVTCTGTGGEPGLPNPQYDNVIVGADTPSQIGLSMTTFARSAIAFAIMTSKIEVRKSVAGRSRSGDSFDVSATSPEGSTIATASTGPSNSASTGELTVLPRTNGASYTLSEAPTPGSGTQFSEYSRDWTCTNNGAPDPSLPSGAGRSVQVSPEVGDDIQCTVTNTPLPAGAPRLRLSKRASEAKTRPGEVLTYKLTVRNRGVGDARNVRVCDRVPNGLKVLKAPGAAQRTKKRVCWKIDLLPSGAKRVLRITAQIEIDVKPGKKIRNTARARGPNGNTANAGDTVEVRPTGDDCPQGRATPRC